MLTTDDTYGPMQLSTYIAAGEGDLYLPAPGSVCLHGLLRRLAAPGGGRGADGFFTDRDISLQSGWRREADSGESHLYGIPLSRLPGLEQYLYVENGYLAVLITNRNDENVMKFLRILCEDMLTRRRAEVEGAG